MLEIRSYRLRPGTADLFDQIFAAEVRPLLDRYGIRVVRAERSIVEDAPTETHYTLIRYFDSAADRAAREEAFYGSDDWRNGPRERILECIDAYHTVVLNATRRAADELAA